MTLIIHELGVDDLTQVMTPDKDKVISAVRPHIYRHNFATGALKVQILDMSDTLVAESETINISDIGPGNNFYHGYIRFYINAYLTRGTSYKFKLVSVGGYSFSESSYIGWATDFDLAKYQHTSTPPNYFSYPFDLEIWERTTK